jgi:hypothetical protein
MHRSVLCTSNDLVSSSQLPGMAYTCVHLVHALDRWLIEVSCIPIAVLVIHCRC